MTTDRMVCLTIDGQEIQCAAGCTVYEAATDAGIHIPTFCHYEKLVPVGACRMCLVEIEGARGLQTSCSTPVRDGMVVKVHSSPDAVRARKANLEFLLTNHPLDCPVCDKGGECPLQNQTLQDGPGASRYVEEKRHKHKRYPLSELIVIDQERCVLCWRCIRFLDEWADDHELDLFGRGASTRIQTFPDRPLSSKWQGNTIDICPVGALTSRVFRFESRVWELTNTTSVCPMCSAGCNTVLGVKNNELRRITPRQNAQVNDVWLCDKGRFGHGFVDHPDRLTTPLIRRHGELEPASWDEALELVTRRFRQIIAEDGPQAIAGLGSSRATNEANYLFQRAIRSAIGSNNIDHLGRKPVSVSLPGSLPEMAHKDVVVLLGCDPSTEVPMLELWIKQAILRNDAKVIVANPYQIELGSYGGPWLSHRPGGEAALLNGLAHVILEAGWQNQTARVANADDFRAWLKSFTPDAVERTTGVSAASLRQAADLLAHAKHPAILYGMSWATGKDSQAKLDALKNLTLMLGNVEPAFVAEDNNTVGALEMGVVPDLYPGCQPFSDTKVRNRLSSLWGCKLSPVAGVGFDGMLASANAGSLKALWVMGSDPASDSRLADKALGAIPFLVVQDLFLTNTALQAEVVLPAASFAECDGSYLNLTGRLQLLRAAVRPPGQARSDWWIVNEIARRLVEGKRLRSWDFGSPEDILTEISKTVPGFRGVDHDAAGDDGWQLPPAAPSTRRAFVQVESVLPQPDPEYPLVLVPGRSLYDRGTLLARTERIQLLVPEPFIVMHPVDAEALGLIDGDPLSVVSADGRLGSSVKISTDVTPGVVYAPRNLSAAPLSLLFADRWTLPSVRIVK